jgi:cytoskeletal protein CcmA (bactofilin family)
MKKKAIPFICVALLLIVALPAFAGQSKYFSGASYVLPKDKSVDGDLFVFANYIRIEGKVTGEVFLMGEDITVSGEVAGDAFILGENVKLDGRFLTDSRVLGNTVNLPGTFDGEVSVAGRKVDISGTVGGVTDAAGEAVSVSGTFSDTVNLHGRNVTLIGSASFAKDVNYSAETFNKDDSVVVAGKLNRIIGKETGHKEREIGSVWIVLVFWFVTLCGIIIVGLIVNKIFPDFTARSVSMITAEPLKSIGTGVLLLVLSPIVLVVLIITLVGIPLAILWFIFLSVGLYLGKLFVAATLGGLIISRFFKEEAPFWTRLIVGAVVVYLLLAIPIVGFFLALIVYCLGVGALFGLFWAERKNKKTTPTGTKK